MTALSMEATLQQLQAVLREAFEGPQQSWSYFTDSGAESGLFGTLERVSAAQASRVWAGSTIAAHAHHVSFALVAAAEWIRGDHSPKNWPEGWSVSTVDDAAWQREQQQLRSRYEDLRRAIQSHATSGEESMGGSIGAVAHAAYHLGAIRQKIVASRAARR